MPRLNRILALKDLGLSLAQVARLLDDGLTPEQMRGMLRLKQAELQQQMQESAPAGSFPLKVMCPTGGRDWSTQAYHCSRAGFVA